MFYNPSGKENNIEIDLYCDKKNAAFWSWSAIDAFSWLAGKINNSLSGHKQASIMVLCSIKKKQTKKTVKRFKAFLPDRLKVAVTFGPNDLPLAAASAALSCTLVCFLIKNVINPFRLSTRSP